MTQELVLVALDPGGIEEQRHVLDAARAEADRRNARLEAILVIEGARHPVGGPGYDELVARLTRDATLRANEWLDGALGPDRGEAHVAHGSVADEILAAADRRGATAIVMGERRHPLASRLLGSAARAVSERARCPVILVEPAGRPGEGAGQG